MIETTRVALRFMAFMKSNRKGAKDPKDDENRS